MLNIEKIREFIKQYNISNNKLMQMISSEGTEDNWLENYHIIDHDELLKWKDMIEFDKLEKEIYEHNKINKSKYFDKDDYINIIDKPENKII